MEVILLDKVDKLGSLGDIVKVKPGYARNFLLPKNKAVLATTKNRDDFATRRIELKQQLMQLLQQAKARAEKLEALHQISVPAKVGQEGKLFGSINARHVAKTITEAGIEVAQHEVKLPQRVLRIAGAHEIYCRLHDEVAVRLILHIVPR